MKYIPKIIRASLSVLTCMLILVLPGAFFISLGVAIIAVTDLLGGNMIGARFFSGVMVFCGIAITLFFWEPYLKEHEVFGEIDVFYRVDD